MRKRRMLAALPLLAFLAVVTLPAVAQEPVDLVEGFDDALTALAGEGTDTAFAWQEVPEAVTESDPVGDLFTLEGGTPAVAPPYADLVQMSQFGFTLPRDAFRALFGDGGVLDCGRPEVSCPTYETSPQPFAEGAFVFGFQVAAAPDLSGAEALTFAVLAHDDDFPTFQDPRPASPFVGTNKVWRVDLSAEGDAVAYLQVVSGPFEEFHTDARVILAGDHVWFLIPPAEFPLANTVDGVDGHTNAGEAADSVAGVNPREPLPAPVGQTGGLRLSPPPEESPSGSPSVSPPAESPVGEGGEPTPESEGGDFLAWVLLGVGVFSVVVGGLLFTGHRRTVPLMLHRFLRGDTVVGGKPPAEDLGPPGPGETVVRGKPPAQDMGPPRKPPIEYAYCDWSVYYNGMMGPVALRKATGRECCVYHITVTTRLAMSEWAARGRQEPGETPHVPEGRLRIPAFTAEAPGLNMSAGAYARSGPAGDLSWMQGLGEPSQPAEVGEYRQLRLHEEPPDVAAHLDWALTHTVAVTLESECPGHRNRFRLSGGSHVDMWANQECTNVSDGECPIELSGAGWSIVELQGSLAYRARHSIGTDPDELEPVAPEGTPFHAITDLHDHAARDRADYSGRDVGFGSANVDGDAFSIEISNWAVLDAGQIVPPAVWPSTGRVTVDVASSIETTLVVVAEMERTECLTGPCCDLPECRCDPWLGIVLDSNGVINVDGKQFNVRPNVPKLGADVPWELV